MAFLKYISDDDLISEVKKVLDVVINRKKQAPEKFHENVIDPFSTLFEAAIFDIKHSGWRRTETIRQCQKTLTSKIGKFHQNILGHVTGWVNLKTGSESGVDLQCKNKKLIAEVKNKHNTITGGKLVNEYIALEELIMPKASKFVGYTAYFVTIVPSKPSGIDEPFTPSNKKTGVRCVSNKNIRIIDGASFYALVTGRENALGELYKALPKVIERIYRTDYKKTGYNLPDKAEFSEYFKFAYIKKKKVAKKKVAKKIT